MAKSAREKIRLVSSAGTGHFYTTDKNKRNMPEKMEIKSLIQPSASTLSTKKLKLSNKLPKLALQLLLLQNKGPDKSVRALQEHLILPLGSQITFNRLLHSLLEDPSGSQQLP